MKMKQNHKPFTLQIGASFLFVIFVVLCLVVLATLSLSTALHEQEYSKKAAQKTTEYYHADSLANRTLMQIDTILQETLKNKPKASLPQIKTALQEVKNLNFSTPTNSNKELIASYDIPVNATQQLHVTLSVAGENSNQQERCRIITWNVISTTDWKSETHLPVIGSEYKGEKCK